MRVLGSARRLPPSVLSVVTPAPSPVLAAVLPHGQMALQVFRLIPWRREKRVGSFLTKRAGCLQALVFPAPMVPPFPKSSQTQLFLKPPSPGKGFSRNKVAICEPRRHGRFWTEFQRKRPLLLETDERKDHLVRRGQWGGSEGGVFIWDLNPGYFQKECWWRPPGPASPSCNTCWTGMRSSSSQMKLS